MAAIRFGIAFLVCFVAAARAAEPKAMLSASSSVAQGSIEVVGRGATASATLPNGDTLEVRNGDVFIDGEQVPADASRFTSKTGKVYVIARAGDRISVHPE